MLENDDENALQEMRNGETRKTRIKDEAREKNNFSVMQLNRCVCVYMQVFDEVQQNCE